MGEPAPMAATEASLWRNRSFMRLWFAQVVSNAGSQITQLALPLTAVLALGATPAQMGALGVAASLPNLLFGLFAGVWVDRTRRRPLLVGADLGRALLLGSIPAAALLGALTVAHLYLVAFAAATLGLCPTALGGVGVSEEPPDRAQRRSAWVEIGQRATLAVGAIGVIAALALLYCSPVRDVRGPSQVTGGA